MGMVIWGPPEHLVLGCLDVTKRSLSMLSLCHPVFQVALPLPRTLPFPFTPRAYSILTLVFGPCVPWSGL